MSEEQIQDDVLISEIENSPISETPMSNRDVEQEIKIAELDIKKEELESKRQDRLQRKAYADNIFKFLCVYMIAIFIIIFRHGEILNGFELADSVVITLITTTTANIIGIFILVVRYLFNPSNGNNKGK